MELTDNFLTRTALGLVSILALIPLSQGADDVYKQHNLVSDGFVRADKNDLNLVNAWGIAFNPTGVDWVADNGTGVSTLYDGNGAALPLVVHIPTSATNKEGANPTGIVFNGTKDFVISNAGVSTPAAFIFASEDGSISAWAFGVDPSPAPQQHAFKQADSSKSNAVYKALALGADGTRSLLYAADFHNNKIDVFDGTFAPVSLPAAFKDPKLPPGFAPFGMRNLDGNIYVTYAKQDAAKHDDVAGKGNGFVNVFDPQGNLIRRIVTRGRLNSPWGMAIAPAGFGKFSHRLLVGNFGDGRINAYDLASGEFIGSLHGSDGKALHIEGLWGIGFGNGFVSQPVNTLFFAAGPGDEAHGLYGRIDVVPGMERNGNHDEDEDD
jgi:uncharacterized protein (TIGR03118 family)